MPKVTVLLETALYVADPERSAGFYRDLFGFDELFADDRLRALDVAGREVLLLFRRGASTEDAHLPGGVIPGHDGSGRLHLAFAITRDDLEPWERRLADRDIAITGRVNWPRGGISIYFSDPDGHVVELATPGLWATY